MKLYFIITCIACQVIVSFSSEEPVDCDRGKCRTVRKVITKDMLPSFQSMKLKIPYQCPFFKDRDKFLANEENKEKESASRWSCGYCGKAFIGEIYLDKHYNNRHPETVYSQSDAVCLADFCEIFRCDVLSGVAKPTFWDVALCMEEDMQDLTADCMELMDQCIPEGLSWNVSKTFKGELSKSVCSFLTCKNYYEAPESVKTEEPVQTPYIVLTIFLAIGLILYYCVAINYFWFDTFSDLYEDSDDAKNRATGAGSLFANETKDLQRRVLERTPRQNVVQAETAENDDLFRVRRGLRNSVKEVQRATSGAS